uniref:Progestin and adipoQ receptor family member 3 n=1 Tax=Timema tahoe TaxID=61484 RepID=A0A7R9NZ13_9NEOP|nr:unnamed protein product [Timema tahoe]
MCREKVGGTPGEDSVQVGGTAALEQEAPAGRQDVQEADLPTLADLKQPRLTSHPGYPRIYINGVPREEQDIGETNKRKCTCIFVEGEWKTTVGETSTPDRDSNPYLPVIGSLVQHDSDASDHAASEAGFGGVFKICGTYVTYEGPHIGSETSGGSKVVESSPQPELREYKDALGPLLSYNEAPSHLKFNPYIRSGYRGLLTTKMCLESIFWWTNETVNIWSHIFGWMLFMGLTLYDLVLLNIHASFTDKFIVALLLVCFQFRPSSRLVLFQVCMVLSSLYHTFSCRSEKDYMCFLSFDLFGIALSLLAIYMSGVYYAFWCHKEWQTFYLVTVLIIFMFAMVLQVPRLKVDANVKLIVFVVWAAYGVIPTFHWTVVMGGYANPVVEHYPVPKDSTWLKEYSETLIKVSAHRVGTARTAHFRGGAPTIRTDGTDGDSVCSAALEPEDEAKNSGLHLILIPSPGLSVEWRNIGESVAGSTDVVGASW